MHIGPGYCFVHNLVNRVSRCQAAFCHCKHTKLYSAAIVLMTVYSMSWVSMGLTSMWPYSTLHEDVNPCLTQPQQTLSKWSHLQMANMVSSSNTCLSNVNGTRFRPHSCARDGAQSSATLELLQFHMGNVIKTLLRGCVTNLNSLQSRESCLLR